MTKPAFSMAGFSDHIDRLVAGHLSGAPIGNWRDDFRAAFDLTPEQEASVHAIAPAVVDAIQTKLQNAFHHAKSGGSVQGGVVTRANGTHEILLYQFTNDHAALTECCVIACCDANCRHWHWGNHPACRAKVT